MKRYFDVKLDEPTQNVATLSTKQRRIRKRQQIRSTRRDIQEKAKVAGAPIVKDEPHRCPVDEERVKFYSRGEGLRDTKHIKNAYYRNKLENKEKKFNWASRQSSRVELLLTEEPGFLAPEPGERTSNIKQTELLQTVDITSATKHFDLDLQFGTYRTNFTRNGRHLLIGGRKGHVASFDWVTKRLHCEMNVMEEVFDVQWLHVETMFAVAQKKWLYIYDNNGIEIHCLKKINKPLKLEFLPYHFLLTSSSEEGYLTWLDVSIGSIVSQFNAKLGRISLMTQNPYNAILCTGHSKGIVAMWSPNSKEPVAKMLCHRSALSAVAVDPKGLYMATGCVDHTMNIWDIRNLDGPLQKYKLHSVATDLAFSQKSFLGIALGNVAEVYKDCYTTSAKYPYMRHRLHSNIGNIQFCPFEDVLGIGHQDGYTSVLIPGSGEPNIDALESNPFQTKKQRREGEVKALLEKIQPELISLDPFEILDVNVPSLKEKIEARNALMHMKPQKVDFTPRRKKRRINVATVKQFVKADLKKEFRQQIQKSLGAEVAGTKKEENVEQSTSVLDRFKPKPPKQKHQ